MSVVDLVKNKRDIRHLWSLMEHPLNDVING